MSDLATKAKERVREMDQSVTANRSLIARTQAMIVKITELLAKAGKSTPQN